MIRIHATERGKSCRSSLSFFYQEEDALASSVIVEEAAGKWSVEFVGSRH